MPTESVDILLREWILGHPANSVFAVTRKDLDEGIFGPPTGRAAALIHLDGQDGISVSNSGEEGLWYVCHDGSATVGQKPKELPRKLRGLATYILDNRGKRLSMEELVAAAGRPAMSFDSLEGWLVEIGDFYHLNIAYIGDDAWVAEDADKATTKPKQEAMSSRPIGIPPDAHHRTTVFCGWEGDFTGVRKRGWKSPTA
ncbi:MAG TPA: hypothetical protein PK263_01935 [bacterium]|nr:hypothetical protein [bacterium]